MERRAVVLASGGLDSTTVLAMALADGFTPLAITFRYGQTHVVEVEQSRRITASLGITDHRVLDLPLGQIGGSALVGSGEIPDEGAPPAGGPVPVTYVPARNLIFLSLAVAVAEAEGCRDLFIGANAVDYSGYPDCRPEFLQSFQRTANLGTRDGVDQEEPWFRLHAPLVDLPKSEIIRRGAALGVDYSLTISCYQPDASGLACGRCESCGLRRRGFQEAEISDPTRYATRA